jgi:hypothetical protein
MEELLNVMSREMGLLIEDADDYNVAIYAGEEPNIKVFGAHTVVLRARCPYFKRLLVSERVRANKVTVIRMTNVSPGVFGIILKCVCDVHGI